MINQHQIYKSLIIFFCVISSLERLTLTKGQPRGPGSQGSKGGFFAANWALPYHYQTFSYIPYSLPCVCLLSSISLQLPFSNIPYSLPCICGLFRIITTKILYQNKKCNKCKCGPNVAKKCYLEQGVIFYQIIIVIAYIV